MQWIPTQQKNIHVTTCSSNFQSMIWNRHLGYLWTNSLAIPLMPSSKLHQILFYESWSVGLISTCKYTLDCWRVHYNMSYISAERQLITVCCAIMLRSFLCVNSYHRYHVALGLIRTWVTYSSANLLIVPLWLCPLLSLCDAVKTLLVP